MKAFLLAIFVLPVAPLRAADAEPEIPKISTFNAANVPRNPFVRLDAKNGAEADPEMLASAAVDDGLADFFKITAVSIDRLSIAVINRRAFAEKDTFRLRVKDKVIRVTVVKVQDGTVELDCGGTTLLVPVRRKLTKLLEE